MPLASQIKTNGVYDWYAVLGIEDCKADAEAIRNAYRKLAFEINPDKKLCSGRGSFKLVSEAWKVLSVPSSSQTYDQRRGPARLQKRSWQEKDEQGHNAAPKFPKRPASGEQPPPHNGPRD